MTALPADARTVDVTAQFGHENLVAHLRSQFDTYGDTRSFTYLREFGRGLVEEVTSFRDLDRGAREVAAWLADMPQTNRPVVLLFEPGVEFWRAFLGCLYAGVIAVPAPLPHDQRSLKRVAGILRDADSRLLLTSANLFDLIARGIGGLDLEHHVECMAMNEATFSDGASWTMPYLTAETVAFLQYTSGSTGDPKGVAVTHGNILHNEYAITQFLDFDDNSKLVGWIPHFHDMGLISQIMCFYAGMDLVIMSPLAFLKQPIRLLQAISRYRATATAAPNFSYDLIARRVSPEQLDGLDLSTVRVAFNGAEPIRRRTIEAINELLGPAGFRPSAMRPGYGLAEVTLFATATPETEAFVCLDADAAALERNEFAPPVERAVSLVSSGIPGPGIDVRIVDPETRQPLSDGSVGEIWLRGDSVASGYYNRAPESEDRFGGQTADGEGPYLRTGDLGLIKDRHLYVTGRRKDLLIVNGRNLYPQDIEELVQDVHPATYAARGVAVAVDGLENERLVVIQTVRTDQLDGMSLTQLASAIKVGVARAFEIPAPSVVLVGRNGIHLTTSGKVQRSSMRTAFLHRELSDVLHESIDPAVATARIGQLALFEIA
ncbi:AMP-binding protein [Mycobacterium sp. 852002-51163_SCH5372311]|uniref:fatty acyl-AMP ligase n=1 Tax=Mycobacterium sp. 852002-51163_SCH5372311 TaxID=1834097 RepID=UPI000801E3BB|nr:fatty acyl-AMP ligase [Mycobacterium sp. 852002-51163_SCH5372311]OBF86381.1 AMP-binding protein [Mycobacterium sp. 852002-51163_SCH5372311]